MGDCTTAEIAVFVCQGYQQRENEKQLPKGSLRHPNETKVRKELADIRGRRKVFLREVHDFIDLYWRVRYGDWQEPNSQELKQGKELATPSA